VCISFCPAKTCTEKSAFYKTFPFLQYPQEAVPSKEQRLTHRCRHHSNRRGGEVQSRPAGMQGPQILVIPKPWPVKTSPAQLHANDTHTHTHTQGPQTLLLLRQRGPPSLTWWLRRGADRVGARRGGTEHPGAPRGVGWGRTVLPLHPLEQKHERRPRALSSRHSTNNRRQKSS